MGLRAEKKLGVGSIVLKVGDITKESADAIVNAANSSLLGGGGVDGAIHRAGGPIILEECQQIRARQGGCPTGQAVITSAGKLPATWVIHAVGPRWSGGNRGEDGLLRSAYRNSLQLARERQLRTVAFPSISTGAYRYPVNLAAAAALETVVQELGSSQLEVRFVLFSAEDFEMYRHALDGVGGAR
jgi:O-acetyl-ADP-ribose deacetylase (regulator of RNase III)